MDSFGAALGARIRQARQARGLAQEDLGQLVGVRGLTISRAELGKTTPNARVLDALARQLGVSVDWLLTGQGRAPEAA
jgi:transcriptional regulator with XRE-family HTH domain